jgi:hypothetical protein
LIVERQEKLGAEDRIRLGNLLLARAKARVEIADPAALGDLEHAKALGADTAALLPRALELAAVADLRHSSAFTRARAKPHLERLRKLAPDNVKTWHEALVTLDRESVLRIFEWFQVAGAKRHALRVAEHYVRQGGRDASVVAQWLELHRWWYGKRTPPLPSDAASLGEPELSPLQRLALELPAGPKTPRKDVAQALSDAWQLELWVDDLLAIENAYVQDPALADRMSRRFVDADVYGSRRLAALTELFHRLGDSSRAKAWAIELASLSRGMPSFSLAAGLACAFAADLGPANQYFVSAAAASGDPGRYWALAARALRRAGHHLSAIAANRRALALTAEGRDLRILFELNLAQRALGRSKGADTSMAELLSRVDPDQDEAAKLLISLEEQLPVGQAPDLLSEMRVELGF